MLKSRSIWVEEGLVKGKIFELEGRQFQMFQGIPYAEPPIGKLRFSRPVKRRRWHQEYDASEYAPPCIQFMDFHINDTFSGINMRNESEDCLYLNIFSPYDPADESKLHPILVWIHGGSFLAGSGDTGINKTTITEHFVFNGIVFVTFNYRLGPLGFLTYQNGTRTEGNFGIWDQVMALQWIHSNIKQFNGDPERVTIVGESAGAASVSLLAVSPRTKGLVQRAIVMSGSSTAGWAIHRHGNPSWSVENVVSYLRCEKSFNEESMKEFLEQSGQAAPGNCNLQETVPHCITNGGDLSAPELVECLRNELNLSSFAFRQALADELGVSKIIVDGDLVPSSGSDLITEHARIPLMIGVARNEWAQKRPRHYGFLRDEDVTKERCFERVREMINEKYHVGSSKKLRNSTLELIANVTFLKYLETPESNWNTSRVLSQLQKLEADIEFVSPAQKEIDAYASKDLPLYVYSFDFFPQSLIFESEVKRFSLFGTDALMVTRNETSTPVGGAKKAFHGLDHAYIFSKGRSSNIKINFTKRDAIMSRMLIAMITNFVKYGNPSHRAWNNFVWPKYTSTSAVYAILDLPPKKAKGTLHWPVTNFWNKEAALLEEFAVTEKGAPSVDEELTTEERLQLSAYRRAWWALWLLVAVIALVIWVSVICIVVTRCHSPRAKPYDNIVVNR